MADGVESIKFEAFNNCTALETIEFSANLKEIGMNVFYGCTALEKVELPNKLEKIGAYAFDFSGLTSVSIPKNVKQLDDCAFADCMSLKEVKFDKNAEVKMGTQMFRNCQALEQISLPDTMRVIPHSMFQSCFALKKITLPKYLQVIRSQAFGYCTGLEEITIGEYVTEIGNSFPKCEKLATVYNYSMLDIQAGADTYGGIAKYATKVVTK
jgi:hypothetical protein